MVTQVPIAWDGMTSVVRPLSPAQESGDMVVGGRSLARNLDTKRKPGSNGQDPAKELSFGKTSRENLLP